MLVNKDHPIWPLLEMTVLISAGLLFTYLHADSWDDEWKTVLEMAGAIVAFKFGKRQATLGSDKGE